MTVLQIVTCRSCNARIIFFLSRAGRMMPVDADSVRPTDTKLDLTHMVSHFATCTHPDQHRKPRKKR